MEDMKARILIVEDDPNFSEELLNIIDRLGFDACIDHATNRNDAIRLIQESFFDFLILDLTIPTQENALDGDPDFGYEVFREARRTMPGTPSLILTGSSAQDFIPQLLEEGRQEDIWGEGKQSGVVVFLPKHQLDECPAKIKAALSAISSLSDVELVLNGTTLGPKEERIIKIFSRKFHGAKCVVSPLGGGLSGVKVVRLVVTGVNGSQIHNAVAKIGPIKDIDDETGRFNSFVTRLHQAATTRLIHNQKYGAGDYAGVFYGLADEYKYSAIEWSLTAPEKSTDAVQAIANAIGRWSENLPESRCRIKQYRQRVLKDEAYEQIKKDFGLDWTDNFEEKAVQTRWGCIHGDLHGLNALVSDDSHAVVIDYGDVGEGPISFDPITLELSTIFHPEILKITESDWPTASQLKDWQDIESYITNCPFPEFIRACREWAKHLAAGNRELFASAYAYTIRQLKYPNTDKIKAVALLEKLKELYDQT